MPGKRLQYEYAGTVIQGALRRLPETLPGHVETIRGTPRLAAGRTGTFDRADGQRVGLLAYESICPGLSPAVWGAALTNAGVVSDRI